MGLLIWAYVELMPDVASVEFKADEKVRANLLATKGAGGLPVSVVMAGREWELLPFLVWTQYLLAHSLAAFTVTYIMWIALIAVFCGGGLSTSAGTAASTMV